MDLKFEAINIEDYLKNIVKNTNDLVVKLADKEKLPYLNENWEPSARDISTSVELTDLNKQITELNKADLGLERSLIMSACDAQIIDLRFKDKDIKEIPYFEVLQDGESKMLEVRYMYFLDQFTKESVDKAFNLVKAKSEDPILQSEVRNMAKNLIDNFISFDVGHKEKKKESYSRENIKNNIKKNSINSKKMKKLLSIKAITKDQRIVYKVLHSYYAGQLSGKTFLKTSISDENFNKSAKRLAEKGLFLKTAFDAQMAALRLSTPQFELPKTENISFPKAAMVKEFDEKSISKSKSENLKGLGK